MPNTGRPSRNCHLCRARRVKVGEPVLRHYFGKGLLNNHGSCQCDLIQPACSRCTAYGAVCPGYRTEIDLMFQHENPGTIMKNKRKGRLSKRTANLAVQDTRLTMVSQMPHTKRNPSVCLLLHHFAATLPGGTSYGFLTFLPQLYSDPSTDECMVLAAEAFAHMYLAKNVYETEPKHPTWLYCTALQATNVALSSPHKAATDIAIATVWLLGMYEASSTGYGQKTDS